MDRKVIRAFVVVKAVESLSTGWFFATYVLFLQGNGLTLLEANLLNVSFMLVGFLFDPLTGYLADLVGQKKVYIWGQLFWAAGTFVYFSGRSFPMFMAAEMTSAIGSALISEALESWLRNHLNSEKNHQVISKTKALMSLATIPSALLGSMIGNRYGLQWPWFFSASNMLACAGVAIFFLRPLPEKRAVSLRLETNKPFLVFCESLRVVADCFGRSWRSPTLRFTVLVSAFSAACFQPFNMFWSPILKQASGSADWLGSLWIGVATLSFLGNLAANSRWLKPDGKGIALALVLIGLPMLPTCFLGKTWSILTMAFLAHEFGRGAIWPLVFTQANQHIPSELRSTLNSIRSSSRTFGAALGLLASGLLTLVLSPLQIWSISAAALILLSIFAWRKNSH